MRERTLIRGGKQESYKSVQLVTNNIKAIYKNFDLFQWFFISISNKGINSFPTHKCPKINCEISILFILINSSVLTGMHISEQLIEKSLKGPIIFFISNEMRNSF